MTYKSELKNFKEQVKLAESDLARLGAIEFEVLDGFNDKITMKDLLWVIEKARYTIVHEKFDLLYH